jgi:WhiB family redox-sensing transcriptional regulator
MPTAGPGIPKLPGLDWQARAACRHEPADALTPHEAEAEESDRLLASRDRLCHGQQSDQACSVLDDCRVWALATRQPTGVWGGLSAPDRDELLGRPRRRSA